jgi:hypothetical protein
MFGVPQMGLQSNCANLISMDHQSSLLESQALFHIAQFGAMMRGGLWRKKFISVGLFKYVEFWKQDIDQNTTYAMKMAPYDAPPHPLKNSNASSKMKTLEEGIEV